MQILVRERADRNILIYVGSSSAHAPGTSSGLFAYFSNSPYRENSQFSKETDPSALLLACCLGGEEGQC